MSETVAKRTKAVSAMIEATTKGRALMGGTAAMRKAGEAYLPRFDAESAEAYAKKLQRSTLFEAFPRAVEQMTGKVFAQPVEIVDAPDQMNEWVQNIDMQGRDLSTFALEVFRDAFVSGVSYIMVEAPRRDAKTTRQKAAEMGLRPYLVHLQVEEILGWKTALFGNVLALSQLRIMEHLTEQDPADEFSTVEVEQVRVLDRLPDAVQVRLYRKGKKDAWAMVDKYLTEAPEITVIPYYAKRSGFFTGKPPLEGMIDVNISHWQLQSGIRNNSHYSLIPVMLLTGFDDETEMVLSSSMAMTSRNAEADAKWVATDTAAVTTAQALLKDLEDQMEELGLQLTTRRVVNESATGAALAAAKETSTLAMMADSLKDALEQAMTWVAFYGGLGEPSINVEVNKEFSVDVLDAQDVMALLASVTSGNLSQTTFINELARRNFINPDIIAEDEIDAIDFEEPDLGEQQ
jgi:hypothetical protein